MLTNMLRARGMVAVVVLLAVFTVIGQAVAGPVVYMRIGDDNGFGYEIRKNPSNSDSQGLIGLTGTEFPGIKDAQGNRLDANNNRTLDVGEYLPDLDGGGTVASGGWDGFNHRTAAMAAGNYHEGTGYVLDTTIAANKQTSGSQWTDISITDTYYTQFPGPNFNTYLPTSGVHPPPDGYFPETDPAKPNNAVFQFALLVGLGDIDPNEPLSFNIKHGDYNVTPGTLEFYGASDTTPFQTLTLTPQPATGHDALIQLTSVQLPFSSVFTSDGSNWQGYLKVIYDAPHEPFYAVDYVELGWTQANGGGQPPVAEPSSAALVVLGAVGGLFSRKRRT